MVCFRYFQRGPQNYRNRELIKKKVLRIFSFSGVVSVISFFFTIRPARIHYALMNSFSAHTVFKSDSTGFTLLELVVVISIMMILLEFSIAPYNYYADKARVRLSVERVEQMMNKAKLLAGT